MGFVIKYTSASGCKFHQRTSESLALQCPSTPPAMQFELLHFNLKSNDFEVDGIAKETGENCKRAEQVNKVGVKDLVLARNMLNRCEWYASALLCSNIC